jgi:hypothetical protein
MNTNTFIYKKYTKSAPGHYLDFFSAQQWYILRGHSLTFASLLSQVGDSDQKLPEGISLYSIASDNFGKPSIIGPLIKVSIPPKCTCVL